MTGQTAPYGSWTSPITAESIARGSVWLGEPELAGHSVWWIEARPAEGGRQVLVRAPAGGGEPHDLVAPPFSARTRVHEYGGGAYAVDGERAFFSNDDDGRVYRLDPGAEPEPISPEPSGPRTLRYADFAVAPGGERVLCVRESHETDGEPLNEIVSLPVSGGEPEVVASGNDFYAAPRPSADGSSLAWICWDHPRMPWNGTELWRAGLDGSDAERVAGGPGESVLQPAWDRHGTLHWISDRSGWWNLYRDGDPLYPAEAEFSAPLWVFGQATYAFLDDGRIACAWLRDGFPHLGVLDPRNGSLDELEVSHPPLFRAPRITGDGRRIAYVGASPTHLPAVVVVDTSTGELTQIARSGDDPDPRYLSEPEPVSFDSHGRTAHALFFPPRNADFEPPPGERPPLIVMSHGGPTAHTEPALDLEIQFWTSRGFAVADVNYGGSTGYGRAYRELLRGTWGVVDLEDCAAAALHLAERGAVDRERLAIRGGSAGGYTTLCALTFTDIFHAGASYFGVADIEPLFAETHKFESRYGDWLVPAEAMRERSPIHSVDRISAAVIVFQGLEDPVVPPAQAELIVGALARRGVEHEYLAFEGESHGFRKAETIVAAFEAELEFYGRVFGWISGARAT